LTKPVRPGILEFSYRGNPIAPRDEQGIRMRGRLARLGLTAVTAVTCAILIALSAPQARADEGVYLSAKVVRTWIEGKQRVILLDRDAKLVAPGGTILGDSMVVWFDERGASKSGMVSLIVYNESGGHSTVTRVQTRGSLTLDEKALLAFAPPTRSDLLARAKAAVADAQLAGTVETMPTPPAPAAPQAPTAESTAAIPAPVPVEKQPAAEAPSVEGTAATAAPLPTTPSVESTVAATPEAPVPPAIECTEAAPLPQPPIAPVVESTEAATPAPSAAPTIESTVEASLSPATTTSMTAPASGAVVPGAPGPRPQHTPVAGAPAPATLQTPSQASASVGGEPTPELPSQPVETPEGVTNAPNPKTPAQALAAIQEAEELKINYGPTSKEGYRTEFRDVDGRQALIATGGIEVSFLDYKVRADSMVIYMPRENAEKTEFQLYAEGNIRFTVPGATMEASRLFYDFDSNRATLIDAGIKAKLPHSSEPLVMRAEKIRALSPKDFEAFNAYITVCDFAQPHFRIGSKKIVLAPVVDSAGNESSVVTATGNRVYAGDVPFLYWPRISRDVKQTHIPLRRLQFGHSSRFGYYTYTGWDMLDILAGNSPNSWASRTSHWADVLALLDYRSKRGPGTGFNGNYAKGETTGSFITYYTHDEGTDVNGHKPSTEERWRLWWQQRTFYDDLQIDTRYAQNSDEGFLNEYYEAEAKEAQDQDTFLYLKRPWEHSQAELLYLPRVNSYTTQTEYLPQARYDVVGLPLLSDKLVFSSVNRADNVRFSPAESLSAPSYQTQRVDTFNTFDVPLHTDPGFSVTPFTTLRQSVFEDSATDGTLGRFAGSVGAKLGLPPVWRTFDVENKLLDINRLRHVAVFDVTYQDVYNSSREPTELLQFDDIDQVDELQVATLRLSQRLQTKRAATEKDAPDRTVDLLGLDVEADYFPADNRDNDSKRWSRLRFEAQMAITDDVSIIGDGIYNVYNNQLDEGIAWLKVDQSPRTTWAVGQGYVRGISSELVTARIDHEINERWAIAGFTQYNYDIGEPVVDQVMFRRSLHEFALDFYFRYDKTRNDTSGGINLYPLGALSPTPTYY